MRDWTLLALALMLAGCAGLPPNALPPRVAVAGIDPRQVGVLEQRFDVGLRIANPNDFDLVVEALEFELEVNGRPFARGVSRTSTRIEAASTTLLNVDAATLSKDLLRQLKALSPETLKTGLPYRVKGRVKIERSPAWLPFDHSGVYGGKAKPAPPRTI
ncbi:MAG: LEA type 2 family protein [Thiobacillus sp.]